MADTCLLCQIIYGFDEPHRQEFCGNNRFLSIVENDGPKTKTIFILPKKNPSFSFLRYFLGQENSDITGDFRDILEKTLKRLNDDPSIFAITFEFQNFYCERSSVQNHQCFAIMAIKNPA